MTQDKEGLKGFGERIKQEGLDTLRKVSQPEVIQLDEITILEVELLAAKMRTQELEERLAIIAVRDAREKKLSLSQEEGQLIQRLSEKYNLGMVDSFKLIDRQKRLCAITRKSVAPIPG